MFPLLNQMEAAMRKACVASIHPSNPCVAALDHHFLAGGSRLRARICAEASLRLGISEQDALCLAVVCELLHNASLVQDDLLDRTALRRGKPSLWAAFSDGTAVCSGDLMLASAYAAIAGLSATDQIGPCLSLIHRRTCEVISGEAAEIAAVETGNVTEAQYERLAQGKSGSLLGLSLELPLALAGYSHAGDTAMAVAGSFAIAYQIADDLEDVAQDLLSGSLNIVTVLRSQKNLSQAQAEESAAGRARDLSDRAVRLAETLPAQCAVVLVEHAKALTARLSGRDLTVLSAFQG